LIIFVDINFSSVVSNRGVVVSTPGYKCSRIPIVFATLSIAVPLIFIAMAATLSGWFNIYENALSDLGHAVKSNVAWIFNLGLTLGGALIIATSVKYIVDADRLVGGLILFMGYALILVGTFDKVYRELHFQVSALFFILLLLTVLIYPIRSGKKKIVPIAVLVIVVNIIVWYFHFASRIPPGAAIPELISVFSALYFYIDAVKHYSLKTCK